MTIDPKQQSHEWQAGWRAAAEYVRTRECKVSHAMLLAQLPEPPMTDAEGLVEFVNRATLHLNRLATWAQQDPTGPTCAKDVQQWVLNEIRLALGQSVEPTPYVPIVFQYEPDAVLAAAEGEGSD